MAKKIVLTEADRARLSQVLDINHSFGNVNAGQCLRELNSDLQNAEIVDADEVPNDVVTMNSRVVLKDLASNEEEEWVLCFPNKADIYENRLSVLAPMGVAMLGTRPGDVINWITPRGEGKAEIVKISYQPEAAGDFHL
jgi:regulator of nucleoside diphosphate kinase